MVNSTQSFEEENLIVNKMKERFWWKSENQGEGLWKISNRMGEIWATLGQESKRNNWCDLLEY